MSSSTQKRQKSQILLVQHQPGNLTIQLFGVTHNYVRLESITTWTKEVDDSINTCANLFIDFLTVSCSFQL